MHRKMKEAEASNYHQNSSEYKFRPSISYPSFVHHSSVFITAR